MDGGKTDQAVAAWAKSSTSVVLLGKKSIQDIGTESDLDLHILCVDLTLLKRASRQK